MYTTDATLHFFIHCTKILTCYSLSTDFKAKEKLQNDTNLISKNNQPIKTDL